MKRRVFLLATVALVGVLAFAVRDLASLSRSHDFETVQAMLALRATQVHVDAAEPHGLLARAPGDRRVGHVSPVRPPRASCRAFRAIRSCRTWIPKTKLPYEWQFASAHRASTVPRNSRVGDPRIQLSASSTPASTPCPISTGKIDVALRASLRTERQRSASDAVTWATTTTGHGTAVASLIAAGDDDGFGMAGFGGAAHVIGIHVGSPRAVSTTPTSRSGNHEARRARRADRQPQHRRPVPLLADPRRRDSTRPRPTEC